MSRSHGVPAWLIALLLFVSALAVRAALWNAIDDHPWWLAPLLDARLYHRLGSAIAAGGIADVGELPVGPLYPVILGTLYALFPADPWTVRIAQGLLGATLPPVLFLATDRIAGRAAAIAAGVLALLAGPLAAHETDLTPASLSVYALAVAAVLTLPGVTGPAAGAARGVAFALAASLRPNLLLLLPLPFVLTWIRERRAGPLVSMAFACMVVILPQSVILARTGAGGLVAPHGGINLLIGNHHGATGVWRSPWPWHGDIADFNLHAPRAEAERRAGRPLTAAEVSRALSRDALLFWRERPGEALALTARKAWLLVNDAEAPLNLPFALARREVLPLALLPVTWGVLLPLALLGVWLRPAGDRAALPLAALAAGGAATILPFFVADRYRLCLYPPLILLAALGIRGLLERPSARRVAAALAGALLLGAVSFLPSGIDDAGERASYRFNQGVNLLRAGRLAEAESAFAELGTGPLAAKALVNRGAIALRRGLPGEALPHLIRAVRLAPGDPDAAALLAAARAAAGG